MLMVSTRPSPHAHHIVCELSRINVTENPAQGVDFQVVTNIVLEDKRGGSYKTRSFLRSTLYPKPSGDGQLLAMYGRGSAQSDHKLVIKEVGTDKVVQEVSTGKPVLDICPLTLNSEHLICVLLETELLIYKWT